MMALLEPDTPASLPGTLASTSPPVARMLRRWNYKEGTGLGARGQGIISPVQTVTRRRPIRYAGIGYGDELYDNGLQEDTAAPAPVQDELCRRLEERSLALKLEEECCDKTLALLHEHDMATQGSDETVDALAVVVESKKVFQGRRSRAGTWRAALPSSTAQYIIEEVVKPRMAAEVKEWMPSWDADCHHWLRPLIPLVGHLPESLYDAVERKIVPRADEYAVISPWKGYMAPRQWYTFARRHVLPRLRRLVRELMITPPKQIDPSFRTVMKWAPLVRARDVVLILEQELFFDRYEEAMRHWLQSAAKPPSAEAIAWCAGWKKMFTPELLAQERVVARLDAVVALVDCEAYVVEPPQRSLLESLLVECMRRLQFGL